MYGIDVRSLFAFRVGLAAVLLVDMFERTGLLYGRWDITAFYTDAGIWTRAEATEFDKPQHSVFLASGSLATACAWWLLGAVGAIALLADEGPRQAAAVCLLVCQGAHWRFKVGHSSYDIIVMRQLFFVACDPYLPLGEWSQRRKSRAVVRIGGLGLLVLQCYTYLGAGLAKSKYVWLQEGTGVIQALRSPLYGRGLLLAEFFREMPKPILVFLSQATIYGEVFIGLLVLAPVVAPEVCRTCAFLLICCLQIGMNTVLDLGLFGAVGIVGALPLLPPCFWDLVDECIGRFGRRQVDHDAEVRELQCAARAERRIEKRIVRFCFHNASLAFCMFGLASMLLGDPRLFCIGSQSAKKRSHGCSLGLDKLPSLPIVAKQVAEIVGMQPFGFDMFSSPRSEYGWFIVLGQRRSSTKVIELPSGRAVNSPEEAYRRPRATWFPTKRWKRYWFRLALEDDRAKRMRERLSRYHCRHWTHLDRIQMFFVTHIQHGWDSPRRDMDYPELKPKLVYRWYCNSTDATRARNGKCPECTRHFIDFKPTPDAGKIPGKWRRGEL